MSMTESDTRKFPKMTGRSRIKTIGPRNRCRNTPEPYVLIYGRLPRLVRKPLNVAMFPTLMEGTPETPPAELLVSAQALSKVLLLFLMGNAILQILIWKKLLVGVALLKLTPSARLLVPYADSTGA